MQERGQLTIPADMRRQMDTKNGDVFSLIRLGNALVATHKRLVTPEVAGAIEALMEEEGVALKTCWTVWRSNGRSTSGRSTVLKPRVFLDTSALLAGLAPPTGASSVVLALAEAELVTLVVSEQVLVEAERNLQEKLPRAIPEYQRFLATCPLERAVPPSPADVATARELIHPKDAPILAAAIVGEADYLVTPNREHSFDDPEVARRSGLRIGTPADFLAWFRNEVQG